MLTKVVVVVIEYLFEKSPIWKSGGALDSQMKKLPKIMMVIQYYKLFVLNYKVHSRAMAGISIARSVQKLTHIPRAKKNCLLSRLINAQGGSK